MNQNIQEALNKLSEARGYLIRCHSLKSNDGWKLHKAQNALAQASHRIIDCFNEIAHKSNQDINIKIQVEAQNVKR